MIQKPITGRRWLLRVGLPFLALLLLVSATWTYWSWEMQRRYDAAIVQMRSRGEPVLISDLDLTTVPDEENAVWYISQAGKSIPPSTPTRAWPGRYTAQDVVQQTAAFDLLRRAKQCTRASAIVAGSVMQLTNVSSLSRLVGDAAILAHRQGDDRAAIERWREMEVIPRSLSKEPVTLIGGLLAVITDQMSTEAMLHIAPTLHIGDTAGVPPAEVHRLIRQLEDDQGPGEACARGYLSERVGLTDAYLTGRSPLGLWPLRPLRLHYAIKACDEMTRASQECRGIIAVTATTTWPQEQQLAMGYARPQFSGAASDVQKAVVRRRLAAAAVAIRLFHAQTDRYPQALGELVPDYLSRIPLDPRTTAPCPLGYALVANGTRPVLWLAGTSTATDEAILQGIPTTPTGVPPTSSPAGTVVYFDASDWAPSAPRITPPSTQQRPAGQDQKPDAPRDQDQPSTQVEQ